MAQYRYSARTIHGKMITGILDGDSESRIQQVLRSNGQYLTSIHEVGSGSVRIGALMNLRDLTIFTRQFHSMLKSGVTVVKCLDLLYQQADKKSVKDTIYRLYESVQKGDLLSASMRRLPNAFPELMISMVETGEASGTLDDIMSKLSENFERDLAIRRRIQGAMIYPAVVSVLAVIVVTGLLVFVMPTFVGIFESSGVALPAPTRMLIVLSSFLRQFWYVVLMILFVAFFAFRSVIASEAGRMKWDKLKLRIPVVGTTLIKIYSVRLTRTLATLVSAGIPLINAMEIASRVINNEFLARGLQQAKGDIQGGVALSTALRRIGEFPTMVSAMIGIGEESGSLDAMLVNTARYYDDESEKSLRNMVSMMEPLLIIIMAVVVGFIVISIMLPILTMANTVKT